MNKQDMTDQIVQMSRGAGKREVTQLQARFVLTTFGQLAVDALRAGEEVQCFGIGKLVAKHAKARKGRNPRTGAITTIKARTVIRLILLRRLRKGIEAVQTP